jgi:hypothetical protein
MAIERKALDESIAKHKKKVEEDRLANEKTQLLNDYVRKSLERQKEASAVLEVEHEIENGIAKAKLQRKLDKVEETLKRQSEEEKAKQKAMDASLSQKVILNLPFVG